MNDPIRITLITVGLCSLPEAAGCSEAPQHMHLQPFGVSKTGALSMGRPQAAANVWTQGVAPQQLEACVLQAAVAVQGTQFCMCCASTDRDNCLLQTPAGRKVGCVECCSGSRHGQVRGL